MRNDRPMGRTLASGVAGPSRAAGNGYVPRHRPAPGRVIPVLRHVVLFTWTDDADEARRATTVDALRRLREDVGGMTSLTVTSDAGLVQGNAHTILVADFPDEESFRR